MEFKREKQMKKILENREIQPAQDLWDKLEKQLDQPQKKSSSYYYWSAIAAVVLMVFLLGGKTFFNSTEEFPQNRISIEESISTPQDQPIENLAVEEKEDVKEEKTKEKIIPQTIIKETDMVQSANASERNDQKNMSLPKNNSEEKNMNPQESFPGNHNHQAIAITDDSKVDSLIKEVEDKLSLEQEVDRLLAEISVENSKKESNQIDADDLLAEIEADLPEDSDRKIREQMHQLLKEGWDKAKIALALNK